MAIDGPAELEGAVTKDGFIGLLRQVRRSSGLSYRQIEDSSRRLSTSGRIAPLSRTTIGDMLNGKILFDEERLIAFLRSCNVSPKEHPEYIVAWRRILSDAPELPARTRQQDDIEQIANFLVAVDSVSRGSETEAQSEQLANSAREFFETVLSSLAEDHTNRSPANLDLPRVLRLGGLDPRLLIAEVGHAQVARDRFIQVLVSSKIFTSVEEPALSAETILDSLVTSAQSQLMKVAIPALNSSANRLLQALISDSKDLKVAQALKQLGRLLPPIASASLEFLLQSDLAAFDADEKPQHDARTAAILQAAAEQLCQLPRYDLLFTGREEDIANAVTGILELYESAGSAAAYFSGRPGAGTSAVAIEVARSLRERFQDRVVYVDMRGLDQSARRSARTTIRLVSKALHLGVRSSEYEEEEEDLFAAYHRSACDAEPFVLLLDNSHNYDQVAPLMPVPSGCVTLVSSRERLTGYDSPGVVNRVEPLDRADSVKLLKHYIQAARHSGDELSALAELCDDLPLALRIVGSRAMSRPDLPVAFILRRLRAENSRLDFLTFGERAIRASISLSYELLDSDEKSVVKGLAVIPGRGVSDLEVQYCFSYPPGRSEALLDNIVNKSLAEQAVAAQDGETVATLYSLPQLISDFGNELARAEYPEMDFYKIQGRSIEFLLRRFSLIDGGEPDQDEREHEEVMAIGQYSPIDAQLELNPARAHAAIELAVETPELDQWVRSTVELAICLETLYFIDRDIPNLLAAQKSEIDLRVRTGNAKDTIAACFHCADRVSEIAGHNVEAAEAAREYLSIAERLSTGDDSRVLHAQAIFRSSLIYATLKDYEAALRSSTRVMKILSEAGKDSICLPVLNNIMALANEIRHYDTSIEWFRSHQHLVERYADSSIHAELNFECAWAFGATGANTDAISLYRAAAAQFEESGQPMAAATSASNAEAHCREGSWEILLSRIEASGNPEACLEPAEVLLARDLLDEALSYIAGKEFFEYEARLYINRSSLSAACGSLKGAIEDLDKSSKLLLWARETKEVAALTYEVELRRFACHHILQSGDETNFISAYSSRRERHGEYFVDVFTDFSDAIKKRSSSSGRTNKKWTELRAVLCQRTITPNLQPTSPNLRLELGVEVDKSHTAIE